MNKYSLIVVSALLIGGFALLFNLRQPDGGIKSEVKAFMNPYQGKEGFTIIKLPDFLMDQVLPEGDSIQIRKENFKAFRVMIFHQNPSSPYRCDVIQHDMMTYLDSLKFNQIVKNPSGKTHIHLYEKNKTDRWKENVAIYNSDSTLFMFNYISNLNQQQVIAFSNQLGYQDFL